MEKRVALRLLDRSEAIYPEERYVYLAAEVDTLIVEMEQAATRRVVELEKASDISIEINNGLHQRIAELEQALREATICNFCGQTLARGQCTGHCDNDE